MSLEAIPRELILTLAGVGLFLSIVVEYSQILAKFHGYRLGKVASGYNSAMKIMVLNRVGTVLYFLFIALSIDLGVTPQQLIIVFSIVLSLVSISSVAVFLFHYDLNNRQEELNHLDRVPQVPQFAAFIATYFSAIGLTVPMVLSATYPDLRLTMANTGFLFNSVFTVVTVFFVESHLAKLMDSYGEESELPLFIRRVYLMRFLGGILATATLLAVGFL